MQQKTVLDVYIVKCTNPDCGTEFHEFANKGYDQCPYCGEYFHEEPTYRQSEVTITLDADGALNMDADWQKEKEIGKITKVVA